MDPPQGEVGGAIRPLPLHQVANPVDHTLYDMFLPGRKSLPDVVTEDDIHCSSGVRANVLQDWEQSADEPHGCVSLALSSFEPSSIDVVCSPICCNASAATSVRSSLKYLQLETV